MKRRWKKISGLVLAGFMVLQTMAMPVFAENGNGANQKPGCSESAAGYLADSTELDARLADLMGVDDLQIEPKEGYVVQPDLEVCDDLQLDESAVIFAEDGNGDFIRVEPDTDEPEKPENPEKPEEPSVEDDVIESTMRLEYDDRVQFSKLKGYSGYEIQSVSTEAVTSYQVNAGMKQSNLDTAAVTPISSTEVIATGVGRALITLEKTSNRKQKKYIHVEVEPATLTLMFLSGQSNAEGLCSANIPYATHRGQSVACDNGTVYATYPPTADRTDNITGLLYSEYCTVNNPKDYVAGSLGWKETERSISGKALRGRLEMLTDMGRGKTGPDSALAYTWHQKTGHKVWVVNAAWGGSNINTWKTEGSVYKRALAIYKEAMNTYVAEVLSGHYVAGDQLMFWVQGEADKDMGTAEYLDGFSEMYQNFWRELQINHTDASGHRTTDSMDGMGIIMVRSSIGDYQNEDEIRMTGPRIAQYAMGTGQDMSDVYVVSNVNEQWVSNKGVADYFASAYPGGKLNYPMQDSSDTARPKTMDEVHYDIHYSQLGHNENGFTAAEGMYEALYGKPQASQVSWKDVNGRSASKLSLSVGESKTLIPVTTPVYAAKRVEYQANTSVMFRENVRINGDLCSITGIRSGDMTLVAKSGDKTVGSLPITVASTPGVAEEPGVDPDYVGFYYSQGEWYYLKKGALMAEDTVVQDVDRKINNNQEYWYIHNGKVQFDYTGFASDGTSDWYVQNGKVQRDKTGLIKDTNHTIGSADTVYYVKAGQISYTSDIVKDGDNWWKIENGKVDAAYTGFASNDSDWWYFVDGRFASGETGLIKDLRAEVNGATDWWFVKNGKIEFVDSVEKNANGWWKITNGRVDYSFTGFAQNDKGWWYLKSGKVQFDVTDVMKGTVNEQSGWWYVKGGKVQFVDSVEKNSNGWWKITAGKVDFAYTGFAKNANGWWHLKDGKVQFDVTDVIKGTVNGQSGWWYVSGGQVQFIDSVEKNSNGWWKITGGKVDFNYTGLAKNSNGTWYLKNGKVQFDYTGTYVNNAGVKYKIVKGKVS